MIPILYESKWLSIQTLWVFVVTALLFSSYLAVKRLKRRRVNFTLFIEHSSFFMISTLIISRLVYFFGHPDAYFPRFDLRTLINLVSVWDQGFSLWGAVLGFTLALVYKLHKEKENMWRWFDALAIPFLIAMMIGSIGAFLSGYGYGIPTELPWGIRYEVFHVKYTVPVHPTQIYLIIGIAGILFSKDWLKKKYEFFKAECGNSCIYLATAFSGLSFGLEFLRGDDTLMLFGIRVSAILFGMIFLTGLYHLRKRWLRKA